MVVVVVVMVVEHGEDRRRLTDVQQESGVPADVGPGAGLRGNGMQTMTTMMTSKPPLVVVVVEEHGEDNPIGSVAAISRTSTVEGILTRAL